MGNIDDFKANLIGGGARANQFRVTLTPPPGIAIGLDVRRTSFLLTASNLPASNLQEIAVPFRGRNIYITGDRPAPEQWSVTVYNDTDFMIRNAMELWQNGINSLLNSFNTVHNEFWVGWIDLLNNKFRWVTKKSIPGEKNSNIRKTKDGKVFDFSIPFIGNNRFNILGIINMLYYRLNKNSNDKIIDYFQTFYPLSVITDTRNISSRRKIVQVQFSIPIEHELELERLLAKLIRNQKPLLCSVKKLADQKIINNLSFYQHGWTIAVDFPYDSFNRDEIEKFYDELSSFNGKIYLAKDLTLDEKNFRKMYPESLKWEKIVKEIDPKNTYQSELSNRLGLKKW